MNWDNLLAECVEENKSEENTLIAEMAAATGLDYQELQKTYKMFEDFHYKNGPSKPLYVTKFDKNNPTIVEL